MTHPGVVGSARLDHRVDQTDVRNGGSWRFIMRNPDGSESGFRGTCQEVTAPERMAASAGSAGPTGR
jgi:uncharacterized protein YndB with AHSA1/START domain